MNSIVPLSKNSSFYKIAPRELSQELETGAKANSFRLVTFLIIYMLKKGTKGFLFYKSVMIIIGLIMECHLAIKLIKSVNLVD